MQLRFTYIFARMADYMDTHPYTPTQCDYANAVPQAYTNRQMSVGGGVLWVQAASGRTTVSALHAMLKHPRTLRAAPAVTQGPLARTATVAPVAKQLGEWTVTVTFGATGILPLYLNGTRNCTVPQVDPETGWHCLCAVKVPRLDIADNLTWRPARARTHLSIDMQNGVSVMHDE